MATIMSCSQSYAPRAKKFNQMTGRVLYFSSLLGAESASRQIAAPCMSGTTGTSAATLAQRPRGAVEFFAAANSVSPYTWRVGASVGDN
jgi:hypothetical protein